MNPQPSMDHRVLVMAPTGRDASLTCSLLANAQIYAEPCSHIDGACAALREGAAVLLVAEEVLVPAAVARLAAVLKEQEAWSDLPILLFAGEGATIQSRSPTLSMLEPLGNVALLERPVRPTTMLAAVRSALRARNRQYEARQALRAERTAVQERDKFLAMLGHELRNPLSPIFVALALLEKWDDGVSPSRSLAVIRRQVLHLTRIVDDLLDVSRVTSGKIVLQRRPLELTELVLRCVQSLEGSVRAGNLTLEPVKSEGPLWVNADAVRLEQIVMNLALNAVKYTPAGGNLRIALRAEGDSAVVSFRDDGAGIPAETLPRIFELFVQADQTLDRAKGGMGIGLTLVKNLVELHGGTVEAESAGPGRGSEFLVRLPLTAEPHEPMTSEVRTGAQEDVLLPRRVLIIEDNEDSREMLHCLLEERGHSVHSAEDGRTGVEKALELRPEVLLVDIGLPGMDGYSVARHVRRGLGSSVLLVALTGYGQPEDRRLALEAGFDRHLTKPILIETVDGLLRDLPLAAAPA